MVQSKPIPFLLHPSLSGGKSSQLCTVGFLPNSYEQQFHTHTHTHTPSAKQIQIDGSDEFEPFHSSDKYLLGMFSREFPPSSTQPPELIFLWRRQTDEYKVKR